MLQGAALMRLSLIAGEAWAGGLQKYEFSHQGERLGTMYLDLFSRCAVLPMLRSLCCMLAARSHMIMCSGLMHAA